MQDITKYWRAREILGNCSRRLDMYMDRRRCLVNLAPELSLASDDKTLDGDLPDQLFQLQRKLGVGPLADRRGAIDEAVDSLSDEAVLEVYQEIRVLEHKLRPW